VVVPFVCYPGFGVSIERRRRGRHYQASWCNWIKGGKSGGQFGMSRLYKVLNDQLGPTRQDVAVLSRLCISLIREMVSVSERLEVSASFARRSRAREHTFEMAKLSAAMRALGVEGSRDEMRSSWSWEIAGAWSECNCWRWRRWCASLYSDHPRAE
jgi:hypothetical protein